MPCALGTYQPNGQQTSCIACPSDTTTNAAGATAKSDCTNPCSSENDETSICPPNGYCLFSKANNTHRCECKTGFTPVPPDEKQFQCMDKCDGFCKNDGACKKQKTGEPYCQCTGSYIGIQCESQSNFAYIVGGSAGKIVESINQSIDSIQLN